MSMATHACNESEAQCAPLGCNVLQTSCDCARTSLMHSVIWSSRILPRKLLSFAVNSLLTSSMPPSPCTNQPRLLSRGTTTVTFILLISTLTAFRDPRGPPNGSAGSTCTITQITNISLAQIWIRQLELCCLIQCKRHKTLGEGSYSRVELQVGKRVNPVL